MTAKASRPSEQRGQVVMERDRLASENKDLRARLGIDGKEYESSWDRCASPELRDRMAVRALLAEWGNITAALVRLGYDAAEMKDNRELRLALSARIFETPGVKALLNEDLADLQAQRAQILARQAQIALYGNEEAASRSATLLSKVAGWSPTEAPTVTVPVNLYTLVGAGVGGAAGIASAAQAKALEAATQSSDPLALLSHDPGAPVRIDSGDDAIKAALDRDEG